MKYEAHELEEGLKKRDTNLYVCGIENLSDGPYLLAYTDWDSSNIRD